VYIRDIDIKGFNKKGGGGYEKIIINKPLHPGRAWLDELMVLPGRGP